MKHLLITAMIAILIGTMQAVRLYSDDDEFRDCHLEAAELTWRCGFLNSQVCNANVFPWVIEKVYRGEKVFRNDVHAYGWDRASNKKKTLRMRWRCSFDVLTYLYDENTWVPILR